MVLFSSDTSPSNSCILCFRPCKEGKAGVGGTQFCGPFHRGWTCCHCLAGVESGVLPVLGNFFSENQCYKWKKTLLGRGVEGSSGCLAVPGQQSEIIF